MSERSELRDGIIAFIIYLLLSILSVFVAPLTIVTVGLLPLPALVYTAMHTRKAGLVFVFVATVVGLTFGAFWAVVTLVCAGAGWGMGQFHHGDRHSIKGLLLTGTVTLVAGFFVLLALLAALFDFNLVEEMEQQWSLTMAGYEQLSTQFGIELNEQELLNMRDMMVSLLPFVLLTASGMTVLINHGVSRLILRRLHVATVKLPPFREWVFPRSLLAWYIISVIVFAVSQSGTYWYTVGLTASWLIQLLFVVQALSLLAALFARFVPVQTGVIIGLVVLLSPLIVIGLLFLYFPLSFLGMLEIGFRFRDKLARTSKSTGSRRD